MFWGSLEIVGKKQIRIKIKEILLNKDWILISVRKEKNKGFDLVRGSGSWVDIWKMRRS